MNALTGEHARTVLPLVVVALALGAGVILGPPSAVLVLAGGALIGVIATFWASIRTLIGETPLAGADAYALGAPRAEEERKRAVLRALKDLEFERSVGKISDDDYQVLVDKYRTEAKRLLKLLDSEAQPRRDQVEALVAKRLKKEGLAAGEKNVALPEPKPEPKPEPEAKPEPEEEEEEEDQAAKIAKRSVAISSRPAPLRARKPRAEGEAQLVCKACGAGNDRDAVFCKKCGARCGDAAEPRPAGSGPTPADAAADEEDA
jgi:hypothetical protein